VVAVALVSVRKAWLLPDIPNTTKSQSICELVTCGRVKEPCACDAGYPVVAVGRQFCGYAGIA
jgi:hypothetical protein